MAEASKRTPFHLMAKPKGSVCNLDCEYCFYLEKGSYFPGNTAQAMTEELLETYVREYIEAQDVPEIHFAWQGGEPTLRGLDFFRRAVELQHKYAGGKRIHNALQTNGTVIDAQWADFLAANGFLLGISIDGPASIHDAFRLSKGQQPTYARVIAGLEHLKRAGVEFNTLTVVTRKSGSHPLKVYRHLKELGSAFMQFIPIIERRPDGVALRDDLDFAGPPPLDAFPEGDSPVTGFSVQPLQFGQFLSAIFDEWVRHDVGRIFVNYFDNALAAWCGIAPPMCVFRETCGEAMIIEHDGSVYSCDHYMYPEFRLGMLGETPLREMADSPQQRAFGEQKATKLPVYCHQCDVRFICQGECPKHRFVRTPTGEPGLNYLCPGLKHFFHHIDGPMQTMAQLLRQGRAPAEIMDSFKPSAKKKKKLRPSARV